MINRKALAVGSLAALSAGLLAAPAAMADTPIDRCTIHEVTMSSNPGGVAWEVTTDAKIIGGDDVKSIRDAEDALVQGHDGAESTVNDLRESVQAAEAAVVSAQEVVDDHPVTLLQAELDAALAAGDMYPVVTPGDSATHTFESPVSTWDVEAVVIAGEGGGGGGGSQDPAAKTVDYVAPALEGVFDLVTDTGEKLRFISTAYESIRVTAFTGPGGSGIKAVAIDQDGSLAKAKDELAAAKAALSTAEDELDEYLASLDALVDAWMAAQGGDMTFAGLDDAPADADDVFVIACDGETVTVDFTLTDVPDGYADPGKISVSVTGGSEALPPVPTAGDDAFYVSAFGESATGQVDLEKTPTPEPTPEPEPTEPADTTGPTEKPKTPEAPDTDDGPAEVVTPKPASKPTPKQTTGQKPAPPRVAQ